MITQDKEWQKENMFSLTTLIFSFIFDHHYKREDIECIALRIEGRTTFAFDLPCRKKKKISRFVIMMVDG
jgi:hypothetical protein